MIAFAMKEGFVPRIGTGRTEWDHIHVNDLAALFVRLVDATQDPKLSSNPEIFGKHGYFFCEAGSFAWGDVATCKYSHLLFPSALRFSSHPPPIFVSSK